MHLTIGDKIKRTELHDQCGGRRMGGISPSKDQPIIMLFTDPAKGPRHGYYDGWGTDGLFYYAGEGQQGDQKMSQGNRAIRDHVQEKRSLHLFEAAGKGFVTYVGEFTLDTDHPWSTTDAPDTNRQEIRKVFVFRLKPKGPVVELKTAKLPHTPTPPGANPQVSDVEVENHNTERMAINPKQEEREAERREAPLVVLYKKHLEEQGHSVTRKKIYPGGEQKPLFTDLFDTTENVLIEAKGSVAREAIRMAIGQLLDYRRFIPSDPTLAVLVPERPREDLIELCTSVSTKVIWSTGQGFEST